MTPRSSLFLVLLNCLATSILALDVPSNVKDFYDHVRGKGKCNTVLKGGFHSSEGDSGDFGYCGDYLDDYKIIYLQGKDGQLVNMDIDCDGAQNGPGSDGRCRASTDIQSETTFREDLRDYGVGLRDLNSYVHPYVVFGNEGTQSGWPTFDPKQHGVQSLSVMAVVCNNKLVYGIWGETNGDDGPQAMVGEASISLATACYGDGITGNSGHDANNVLYVAFTGEEAVPGAKGADWNASSYEDFQSSITDLGNKLVERIGSGCSGRAHLDTWKILIAFILGSVLILF